MVVRVISFQLAVVELDQPQHSSFGCLCLQAGTRKALTVQQGA